MIRQLPKGVGGTRILAFLVLALLAAACGQTSSTTVGSSGNDDPAAIAFDAPSTSSSSTTTPELTTIKVAARNSLGSSPLWIADSRGFFGARGIAIEYLPVSDETAVTAALAAQEAPIGIVSSTAAARSGTSRVLNRPITYIDATDARADRQRGSLSLIAPADSTIQDGCDLEGTRVAVDSIRSVSAIAVREMVLRDGCNPLKVRFAALDGLMIEGQLRSGDVDAAATFDPLTSDLLRTNSRFVSDLDKELCPDSGRCPLWVAVARADWFVDNTELGHKFAAAMDDAMTWISQNEVAYRAELVNCCAVNADDAATIVVPNFVGDRSDLTSDLAHLRTVIEAQAATLDVLRSETPEVEEPLEPELAGKTTTETATAS